MWIVGWHCLVWAQPDQKAARERPEKGVVPVGDPLHSAPVLSWQDRHLMEVVSDEAVTGPTLLPPSGCVCVCTNQHKSIHMHFAVSHWDLTTEWHLNGTFPHCSSSGSHVMLMTVVAKRNKKHFHLISIYSTYVSKSRGHVQSNTLELINHLSTLFWILHHM